MMALFWRLLGIQVLFAVLSFSITVSFTWWFWEKYWAQKNSYEQLQLVAKQTLVEAQSRVENHNLKRLMSDDLARFKQRGWLGHQSRVHWIDHIVALSRDSVISDVRLRFSERVPLKKESLARSIQVPSGVNSEVLSAEAYFMHEWDALQWISRMQKDRGMPLSLLSSCQLKLMSTDATERSDFPVFASCRWLLFEVLDD